MSSVVLYKYRNNTRGIEKKVIKQEKKVRMSSSPYSLHRHNILCEPHIKSLGSLVMLNEYFNNYWTYNKRSNGKGHRYSSRIFRRKRKRFLQDQRKLGNATFCWYCGCTVLENYAMDGILGQFDLTIDHIVPISNGGSCYNIHNFAITCYQCNTQKGEMELNDFLELNGYRNAFVLEYLETCSN